MVIYDGLWVVYGGLLVVKWWSIGGFITDVWMIFGKIINPSFEGLSAESIDKSPRVIIPPSSRGWTC